MIKTGYEKAINACNTELATNVPITVMWCIIANLTMAQYSSVIMNELAEKEVNEPEFVFLNE